MLNSNLRSQDKLETPTDTRADCHQIKPLLVGGTSTNRITGFTIAFDMLLDAYRTQKHPYLLLDRNQFGAPTNPGKFNPLQLAKTLFSILSFATKVPLCDRLYLVIGTSKLGFYRDAVMIYLAAVLKKPIILHLHGGGYRDFYESQSESLQQQIRNALNRSDRLIVLGQTLTQQFSFLPNYQQKTVVVPNGLPSAAPNSLLTKSYQTPIRLLYLSNMIASKGYLELFQACQQLNALGIDFTCDFCGAFVEISAAAAGQANPEQEFLAKIDAAGLNSVVKYHGVVRGQTKTDLLQAAHFFILPTQYPWEGQPISIIEALAFSTPVIATNYRGIPEQVIHGYNGFLLDLAGDAKPLSTQIAEAIAQVQHETYAQLSQNAWQHYQQNFTKAVHLQRLMHCINGPLV